MGLLKLIVTGMTVERRLTPFKGFFQLGRIVTIFEDHGRIFVQQLIIVSQFIMICIMHNPVAESRPVFIIVKINLCFGDGTVSRHRIIFLGDGLGE